MKILCLAHDFYRAGAQFSLLRLIKHLHNAYGVEFAVLALGDGDLRVEYEKIAHVRILTLGKPQWLGSFKRQLYLFLKEIDFSPSLILANTVVTPQAFPYVSKLNIPIITRVAELEDSIKIYSKPEWIDNLCKYSSAIVGVSNNVCEMLINRLDVDKNIVHCIHGAIESPLKIDLPRRKEILQRYNISLNVPILWGCGSISKRKGADLFLLSITRLFEMGYADFHAVWIGDGEDSLSSWLSPGFTTRGVTFVGPLGQPSAIMSPQDIFLLTSREDPFPLAALEAGSCGLPILGFENAGGMGDVIRATGGLLAPNGDSKAFAENVALLLDEPKRALQIGARAKKLICEKFTIEQMGKQWMALFEKTARATSSIDSNS